MNTSTKIFIASLIIFACSVGFFAGSFCMNFNKPCKRACPMMANGTENGPRMGNAPHMNGPNMKGPHMRPQQEDFQPGEFKHHEKKHGHDFHKKMERNIAEMDSVMQVTPEQKEALKANRATMDSIFKALGKQKKEADKEFRDALESGDAGKINAAKAKVLAAEEAMLTQHAAGFAELAKILSPEQRKHFREFRKAKFQKKAPGI